MLTISLASSVPIHDQLVAGLRGLIAAGTLGEGDELPPVRQLAADLGINLNTVARAYTELESEGVIETRQGAGCFLKATGSSPLTRSAREGRLNAEIDALIVQAHHLRIADAELKRLLAERLARFRSSTSGTD